MLRLELVCNILQQTGQLDIILFKHRAAEHGQIGQPHRDRGPVRLGPVLVRIVEALDDAETEDVEGQAVHVLEGVDDGSDQVIGDLNVRKFMHENFVQ